MALHTKTSDRAATEFHEILGALGVAQHRVAKWFGVDARSVRRWRRGDRNAPAGIIILCRLLAAEVITPAQIEVAAASIPVPTRTNGAKPEPSTFLVESAPEQSALARVEATTLADPGLTTAEKVYALASEACRWPLGDPRDCDFRFCGRATTVREPYCETHRAAAYVAPLVDLAASKRVASGSGSNPLRQPFHLRRRTSCAAGRLPVTIPST
jgi:hypothetical protein